MPDADRPGSCTTSGSTPELRAVRRTSPTAVGWPSDCSRRRGGTPTLDSIVAAVPRDGFATEVVRGVARSAREHPATLWRIFKP